MSFLPETVCNQCGTKYFPLRGRCPNCGARPVRQPSRAAATTGSVNPESPAGVQAAANGRWQLIFGGILALAVIVAVIILIAASGKVPDDEDDELPQDFTTPPLADVTETPEPTPDPTPTPEPTVAVTSITITFLGEARTEFSMSPAWGDVQLSATVYPVEAQAGAKIKWYSDHPEIATVDENGLVHQVGVGTCKIIAECGDIAQTCTVYAN